MSRSICGGRRADVELVGADAQRLHQPSGVAESVSCWWRSRASCSASTLVRGRPRRSIARDGDDQGVGRVEAARDADHDLLDPGGPQPGLEALDLDVVDLLAALVAAGGVGGDVGEALDLASQPQRAELGRQPELELDPAHPGQRSAMVVDRVAEAARARPVGDEPVEVDVGEDQLLVLGEPLRLGEQLAVLVDQRLAVPGQVGGRLARARPPCTGRRRSSGRTGSRTAARR